MFIFIYFGLPSHRPERGGPPLLLLLLLLLLSTARSRGVYDARNDEDGRVEASVVGGDGLLRVSRSGGGGAVAGKEVAQVDGVRVGPELIRVVDPAPPRALIPGDLEVDR